MHTLRFRGAIAGALVAVTTGCLHRGRAENRRDVALPAITIAQVTNKNSYDVRVYVLRSGARAGSNALVGIARAFSTQVFEVPRELVETHSVRISIEPIGPPQGYLTDPISVKPGQQIHLVVMERLQQSYYSVFDP